MTKSAVITGGSKGLAVPWPASCRGGLACGHRWAGRRSLRQAAADTGAVPVVGDVTDPGHRRQLIEAARRTGRLDVLVNDASTLGPPRCRSWGPTGCTISGGCSRPTLLRPWPLCNWRSPSFLQTHGAVINFTSDAAVEAYEGWGGYGLSKALLEQLSNVLAVEETGARVWWFDPGDMRTDMHQEAFWGQDISDRPGPSTWPHFSGGLWRSARPGVGGCGCLT